jgi:CRP-like cAMP-binding protein
MEVLETAKVDAYSIDDIIVPASRRSHLLCVVWEGTCSERTASKAGVRKTGKSLDAISEDANGLAAVWHAGDWTGPIALQPEYRLSGESETSHTHDVVALSSEGVKVITIEYSSLSAILRSGSTLYRKYLDRKMYQERAMLDASNSEHHSTTTEALLDDAMKNLNILELLNCNSALRKLSAVQKRHLESLAEGPVSFQPGERLWRAGSPVDRSFIIISGTVSFIPKRRNAGSTSTSMVIPDDKDAIGDPALGDSMRLDAMKAMKELGVKPSERGGDESSMSSVETDDNRAGTGHILYDKVSPDFDNLSRGLQKRADYLQKEGSADELDLSVGESTEEHDALYTDDTEIESQLDYTFTDEADPGVPSRRTSVIRRRSSRARFANKVLGRLYNRRAFTGGLVFSRGHFLGDVSKMVAGLVGSSGFWPLVQDESAPTYGFGDKDEERSEKRLEDITELIIHEQEGDHRIMHSSTLTAGKDGCVVLVFPKMSLIPFLDEYPGLLLSLLGTQVVV